jgi:hypothetical protein
MEDESEKSAVSQTLDSAANLAKAIPIYEDALQPVAKEIGKSLSTVGKTLNLALEPLNGIVWGYEKIKLYVEKELSRKLKDVPAEHISTPPLSVAGPAIEALRFAGHSEELRELFANLLATSIDARTVENAHPAFVAVIQQIVVDEARILRVFGSGPLNYASINWHSEKRLPSGVTIVTTVDHISDLMQKCDLEYGQHFSSYVDNLLRLQLLSVSNVKLLADSAYAAIESGPVMRDLRARFSDETAETEKMVIAITDFGRRFLKAVSYGRS